MEINSRYISLNMDQLSMLVRKTINVATRLKPVLPASKWVLIYRKQARYCS